ncbi:post-GPI attachment to proteins factor 4 [Narcine bancroftii]|uniref:post-GPI attachment to proteins factor 4 n=1 Tax=Narcine bancroftii TaxID=1343680 RepID=UPI0038313215
MATGMSLPRLAHSLSRPWLQLFILYLLVLGVALPLIGQGRRHSYYFRRSTYLRQLTDEALMQSLERAEEAERYFQNAEVGEGGGSGKEEDPPQLAVAIVTTVRSQGTEYRYYLQVASAFHRLLRECKWCRSYRLFACNVHHHPKEHWQVEMASRLVPVIQRFREEGQEVPESDRFEKEKADYLFCLGQGLEFQPKFILMLEDDALPSSDFFPVLQDILERRLKGQDPLYVKLYHPERLQGYLHPEPARILEWVGLGALGGCLLSCLHYLTTGQHSLTSFCALAALSMLGAEMYGRVYLLEVRRASPQLYILAPASECCTPAMVYTAEGTQRVLRYLGQQKCRQGYAKDTALYQALRQERETAYVVEPNLVSHIGLYSTLRGWVGQPSL